MNEADTTTVETDIENNEPLDGNTTSNDSKDNKKAAKDEINESNCKFAEGQLIKFVRVRFPGHAKSYPFLVGKRSLMYGQKVVAMSDRGMAVGYINSFTYELPFSKSMLPLRSINKVASEADFEREKENYKRQKEIETVCQNLIEKHNLDMNLTHVEFTQFGKKVVFYFVAPNRVDFRGLVKDLVTELKLRIELRQISLRDRSASMGALGPCGRELCCSSFLSRYGNVSIKMAKNQNLTLNYSKLNGVCGQLKCCLQYEESVYDHKRKILPDENSMVETKNGDVGLVRKIHILTEQFDLMTIKGQIRRYTADQYIGTSDKRLPREFDSIHDETNNIIGLSELGAKKVRDFEDSMSLVKSESQKFADATYTDLTGIEPNEQVQRPEVSEPVSNQIAPAPATPLTPNTVETVDTTPVVEATSEQRSKSSGRNRNRKNFKKGNRSGQNKKPTT